MANIDDFQVALLYTVWVFISKMVKSDNGNWTFFLDKRTHNEKEESKITSCKRWKIYIL